MISLTYGQASAKIHVIYLHLIDLYVAFCEWFLSTTYFQNADKLPGFYEYVEFNEIIILYIIRSRNPCKFPGIWDLYVDT